MIDLRTHISEAISHGKHKSPEPKYTPFPKKRTDKLGIIKWLIDNDFEEISDLDPYRMVTKYNMSGKGCYNVSSYKPNNKKTHWLQIFDGTKMFMIHTCSEKDLTDKPLCGEIDYGTRYWPREPIEIPIEFDEIRRYFDNQTSEEITEAVSHGRRNLTHFPDKPYKEDIVDWLEYNDYDEVKNNGTGSGYDLQIYYHDTKRKCYLLGLYTSKPTKWIVIYDGENLYTIRTGDNPATGWGPAYSIEFGARPGVQKIPKSMTYEELKYYIDKNG